jgi:RNA polymerase sigma factor (sigma-70 family)
VDKRDFITMIYEENHRFISSIVKSLLYSKCPHDISDCVQDVFNAAFKNSSIQEHENITGWLCDTAKNIVKQYNARHLKAQRFNYEIKDNDNVNDDFTKQVIEDDLLRIAIEKDIINEAIESLSFSERDFYNLRYIKKLGYKEISVIMGKSENALSTKNTRIKKKIQNFIKNFLINM